MDQAWWAWHASRRKFWLAGVWERSWLYVGFSLDWYCEKDRKWAIGRTTVKVSVEAFLKERAWKRCS